MSDLTHNLVEYIKIDVITPVHIGAGAEKKWIKDIDYFFDQGKIKIFDIISLLKDKDDDYLSKVVEAISERKLFSDTTLISKNQIKPFIEYKYNREPDEIFTHIRNGLGKIYIPGSSLKGAIRSALLGYLYFKDQNIRKIGRNPKIDDVIFGNFKNSVMRFIQVTDAEFSNNSTSLFNTKIYSLGKSSNNKFEGQWKHDRENEKGDRKKFSTNGFVNTYECLNIGAISASRIVITENIIKLLDSENKPKNTDEIIIRNNTKPVKEILKMINEQTKNYLEKEIKYFEYHEGDKSEIIIEELTNLLNETNKCKDNACILHLGSGSGFHGITGDWQFENHIINGIRNGGRGQINGRDAAKTRRLIFEKQSDDFVFYPMGFVKLSIIEKDSYNQILRNLNNNQSINNNSKSISSTQEIRPNLPDNSQSQKDIKPYTGKIKTGQGGVPAEVVESGKPNKVKLFIADYSKNNLIPLFGYNNPIEKGKKIYVRIGTVKNDGEILGVTFDKHID
jgi:CRISPR/Cas system CSM-associated protein Csm5 (group 7 of RAMP superfamily)